MAAGEALDDGTASPAEAVQPLAERLAELAQAQAAAQRLEQTRAQLQDAQGAMAQAQKQASAGGAFTSTQGLLQNGTGENPASGQGQGGEANAPGSGSTTQSGHSEDSGTGAPYGMHTWERLEQQGGYFTLPREAVAGSGTASSGAPGSASVPYREVYATYNRAAESTLERQAFPPALRAYVRDYFSALAP